MDGDALDQTGEEFAVGCNELIGRPAAPQSEPPGRNIVLSAGFGVRTETGRHGPASATAMAEAVRKAKGETTRLDPALWYVAVDQQKMREAPNPLYGALPQNFSNSTVANRLGPAKPRGLTWKGAGGCEITSSVTVMSSPSFDSFVDPQQGQFFGAAMTTRSCGKCSGNGSRDGSLRPTNEPSASGWRRPPLPARPR